MDLEIKYQSYIDSSCKMSYCRFCRSVTFTSVKLHNLHIFMSKSNLTHNFLPSIDETISQEHALLLNLYVVQFGDLTI